MLNFAGYFSKAHISPKDSVRHLKMEAHQHFACVSLLSSPTLSETDCRKSLDMLQVPQLS